MTLSLSLLIAFPLRYFAKAAANYFYLCKNIGENDDFVVTYAMPIEGNEKLIEIILDNLSYGTNISTESIVRRIEDIERKQKQRGWSYADVQARRGDDGRFGGLGISKQTDRGTDNEESDRDVLLFREAEPFYSNAERGRRTDAQEVEVEGDSQR